MTDLLELALVAAQRAADLLVDGWSRREVVSTKSSGTDIVTQMDRGSETLLIEVLLGQRPDDGVIGEEGGRREGTSGVTWVIDPLDGTVNYLYGLPVWGVSVAALVDGVASVGVVNAPALGSVWAGQVGDRREATHNGTPMTAARCQSLDQALVATGFGYRSDVRAEQAAIVAGLLPQVRDIRRAGAAAVDMCWVAQGCVDAYFERGTHIWDRAAATAICRAAGAEVIGIDGGEASDAMTIAGNAAIAEQLRLRLLAAGVS